MIIDRIALAGAAAYLQDRSGLAHPDDPAAVGIVNLAPSFTPAGQPPLPAGVSRTGTMAALQKGAHLEVAGVDLQIEGQDLWPLFARQDAALLRVQVTKEMFPGLLADPYAHRVHAIGGAEDFQRGTLSSLEVAEVDGVPALVCLPEDPTGGWKSPVYKLPEPITLAAAAWTIPASLLVADDAFQYFLALLVWRTGTPLSQAPITVKLVDAGWVGPRQPRRATNLAFESGAAVTNVAAFQVAFTARVNHDAFLRERSASRATAASRGRPLLAGVSLLERVDSAYELRSLRELTLAAMEYRTMQSPDGRLVRLLASLALPASLDAGESVSLEVSARQFTNVEARLRATRMLRPPLTDKAR